MKYLKYTKHAKNNIINSYVSVNQILNKLTLCCICILFLQKWKIYQYNLYLLYLPAQTFLSPSPQIEFVPKSIFILLLHEYIA